jgi:hypothetical protein
MVLDHVLRSSGPIFFFSQTDQPLLSAMGFSLWSMLLVALPLYYAHIYLVHEAAALSRLCAIPTLFAVLFVFQYFVYARYPFQIPWPFEGEPWSAASNAAVAVIFAVTGLIQLGIAKRLIIRMAEQTADGGGVRRSAP